MTDSKVLIAAFVHGKVQDRFLTISKTLHEFLDRQVPIVEQVYASVARFNKRPIGDIGSAEMSGFLRSDLELAKKDLMYYNRTFGSIDHHLAMMSSNFQLKNFLSENGIELDGSIQAVLRKYWEETYGHLLHKYESVHHKLERLRDVLEREVKFLESLPDKKFIEGFEAKKQLFEMFYEERDILWDIVKISKVDAHETENVRARLVLEAKKMAALARAHAKVISSSALTDYRHTEGALRKSILIVGFLLGAYALYNSLKEKIIGRGILKFLSFFVRSKKDKGILDLSAPLANALNNINQPGGLDPLLKSLSVL